MGTTTKTLSSSPNSVSYSEQLLARVYTINWEVVAWGAILLLALFTRFYELGERVMSHDESLHTHYSWELYSMGRFEHTPLMHGPLLFHMTAFFYFLFGPSDFSARIYTSLLGVAVVMFPYLFRRWLGRSGAIIAAVGLLISPMLMYYSRYIRHDIPSIFFALVMIYATMQYIDGEKTRRPIWLAVLSGAMLFMLASKEVAFIYIAIFGSYLTFYWVLRMLQDGMIFSHIGHDVDSGDESALLVRYNQSPLWMLIVGHIVLGLFAVVLGYLGGEAFNVFYSADAGPLPENIPLLIIQLGSIAVIFALFESVGFVRTFIAGEPQAGIAGMIANSLKNMRSTIALVMAGVFIGAASAVWVVSVIDFIGPENMFDLAIETRIDKNGVQERYIADIDIVWSEFSHFFQWAFVPIIVLVFVVLFMAILKYTPLPDVLGVLLIALITLSVLVYAERHTVPSIFDLEQQAGGQEAVAIDPDEEGAANPDQEHKDIIIVLAWLVCGAITFAVVLTRFSTHWWDFMNRQPIFDVLIVMGTLIFPWLAAIPVFAAGYQLDLAPLPPDSLLASIVAVVPFFMVSIAVGLAWNWRVWPAVAAVFVVLFLLFFTTFFTNGNGVGTGLIGSLGYWLEQQGVRRGSQPQYYYLWIQMPVYEFLPMILASVAGLYSLNELFGARRTSRNAEMRAIRAQQTIEQQVVTHDGVPVIEGASLDQLDDELGERETDLRVESSALDESQQTINENGYVARSIPVWAEPYDHEVEMARRQSMSNLEYLGGVPFLQLIAYQALIVLTGLTFAGEKMPWLTTHITLPLILISGWYLGRLVDHVSWPSIKRSGWALFLVLVPVFVIALAETILPFVTGQELPFQGNNQQRNEISATSEWLAAFLVLVITGYFILYTSVRVGWANARRLIMLSVSLVLAVLTFRAAWLFTFINYDLATEFGVYAHAGPAVKDVLEDLVYMAERHPDGYNMHIVYDDKSSWPLVWYLRDFTNKHYIYGGANNVRNLASEFDGAVAVIVGSDKRAEVARILGNDYYEFDLIRLWWPMQDYFFLNYEGVRRAFLPDSENPAASLYRDGVWNIWWSREYDVYSEAKCVSDRVNLQCYQDFDDGSRQLDQQCVQRVRNECIGDTTFNIERWPVSDGLYFFVRKDFAAQIWDVGLDGRSVQERLIPDPEDEVQQIIPAIEAFGTGFLNSPRDIEFGPDGNLYVADADNSQIVVFDPITRQPIRFIGVGELNQPQGIAFSPQDGYLYVADTWNFRVVIYTLEGEFVHSFGQDSRQNPVSEFGFFGPREIEVDSQGFIYVSDTGNHRIRVYSPDWTFVRDIQSNGRGLVGEPEPVGIKIHPVSGELFIAETWNQVVSVFSRDGRALRTWDVNMWAGTRQSGVRPYLAISPDGTLILVSDMDDSHTNHGPRIVAYDLNGQAVIAFNAPFADNGMGGPAAVEIVSGMDFDADGNLYVADAATGRIVIFPPLSVRGTVLPIPDLSYSNNTFSSVGDDAATEDSLIRQIGYAYWQAQIEGNYELFRSLHCSEDQAVNTMLRDQQVFLDNTAQWRREANLSRLNVLVARDGDTATITYMGVLSLYEGDSEFPVDVSNVYPPLSLIKRDGQWIICQNANRSPDIFMPGGG